MTAARTFREPSTIQWGLNAASTVGLEARQCNGSRALLVTDENLHKTGTTEPVLNSLKSAGLDPVMYDGVNTEPTLEHVETGLDLLKSNNCDVIVACGGGSPIDTAKAISVMATNPGNIEDYMGIGKIKRPGVPMIAIPTTAGTGSEVTMVTIITDAQQDVKMLLISPQLMPVAALVDPLMTLKMPRHITASTGLDALTHAIEAYVSVKAQPLTDIMALSAIELLGKYLPKAWSNPDNIEARSKTLLGAMQAGIAFSNSSVALVHGMSRPIGAYFHVPHGVSNAALLGIVMEFSLLGATERYATVAKKLGVVIDKLSDLDAAKAGSTYVKKMIQTFQIPSLSALGVERANLDKLVSKMADDAIASGSPGNNPRKATKEEIIQLYYDAL